MMHVSLTEPQGSPASRASIQIDDFIEDGWSIEGVMQEPVAPVSLASPPPGQPPKPSRDGRTSDGQDPLWRYYFCRALVADPRFAALVASHRYILLVGALRFADVNGVFWPRKSTWARDASIHQETVKRAVREAEDVGLIAREAHARPNGRQGSNTYRFDAALVAAASADAGFGQW
jgi:hypothetical protein